MTTETPQECERRPVGRPTIYKPEYCEAVITDMEKGYSLTAFAGLIGVCKATLNVWMGEHPEFLDAVTRAKALRLREWETKAIKVADGEGGPGAGGMIAFGLKNMDPDEWVDKSEVKNSGTLTIQKIERVIVDPANRDA